MTTSVYSQHPPSALLSEPLNPERAKEATRTQLKEQADNFEAVVVKQMLDIAMKHEDSLFGGNESPGSHIYQSMYHESISEQVSGGFGYSELLFKHLQEKL